MAKDWAALQRLTAYRFRDDGSGTPDDQKTTGRRPGRRRKADVRVLHFPPAEQSRATRGATSAVGREGPPGPPGPARPRDSPR